MSIGPGADVTRSELPALIERVRQRASIDGNIALLGQCDGLLKQVESGERLQMAGQLARALRRARVVL